jgi:hypothetical protein
MLEPKEDNSTKQEVGSGSLVRLKYTYKFESELESYVMNACVPLRGNVTKFLETLLKRRIRP